MKPKKTMASNKVNPGLDEAVPMMGQGDQSPRARSSEKRGRLSIVSSKYDIDGDGQLDEAEQAMRDMDTSDKGFLSNDKVYQIMRDHLKSQKDIFKFKKVVIGLSAFVVVLGLCNLGTSFAAAYLAKDTTPNDKGELTSSSTGKAISTQTTSEMFSIQQASSDGMKNTRHLLCSAVGDANVCSADSFLAINEADARSMICLCYVGRTVRVERTFSDGEKMSFPLCPHPPEIIAQDCGCDSGGSHVSGDCSHLYLGSATERIEIKRNVETSKYKIEGDAFTSDLGGKCDYDGDCDDGLNCVNYNCVDTTQPTPAPTPVSTPKPTSSPLPPGATFHDPCDCTGGSANCIQPSGGTHVGYCAGVEVPGTSCIDSSGNALCCEGIDACAGFTGWLKISTEGSCNGNYACYNAKIKVVENGCNGDEACSDANIDDWVANRCNGAEVCYSATS